MASSAPRRLSGWAVTPMLAAAVLGLAACAPPSQESSTAKGTTPPVFSSAPAPGNPGAMPESSDTVLHAELRNSTGGDVGTATFAEKGGYLQVEVDVHGLQPGFHGLHLHKSGKCEGDFTSAGGHWQTGDANSHPAAGDLTSLQVRKDGSAILKTTSDAFTIDELKADGGRALIVHAGADNFGNIPSRYAPMPDAQTMSTGDAGARIACGVVK